MGSSSSVKKGPRRKGKKRSAPAKEEKPTKKPKAKASKPNKHEDVCHHGHKPGHWRRNCKEYLEQLRTCSTLVHYFTNTARRKKSTINNSPNLHQLSSSSLPRTAITVPKKASEPKGSTSRSAESTLVKVSVAPAGGIGISRYGDISVTHEDLLALVRIEVAAGRHCA
ncbi:hypothetical protein F511_39946 [Dorcoceras hygrometricum]|uniref:Uncharacterized protein n=1 Tax=Dorcoceras hygrometricum TaxID=472368 RepID=A0A2Z7BUF2_9LAMI|nr:hypothetical protein F511_39946 [Dorcoceras hygrometricum]